MKKCAHIPIEGENSSFSADEHYFKHNPKRHRLNNDIIIPTETGLTQRMLALFREKSFKEELTKLLRN